MVLGSNKQIVCYFYGLLAIYGVLSWSRICCNLRIFGAIFCGQICDCAIQIAFRNSEAGQCIPEYWTDATNFTSLKGIMLPILQRSWGGNSNDLTRNTLKFFSHRNICISIRKGQHLLSLMLFGHSSLTFTTDSQIFFAVCRQWNLFLDKQIWPGVKLR